jgi:hypothetical protein
VDALCADPARFAAEKSFQGIGEWVEFVLTAQTHVKAITISNGFQKDDALFTRNPRVKKVQVAADGKFVKDLNLEDKKGSQRFELDVTAKNVRLTLADTYLGNCVRNSTGGWLPYFYDTSLSEVSIIPANIPRKASSSAP